MSVAQTKILDKLLNIDLTEKKILIVDDETAIVETLKSVLEDDGYNVLSATSGEEALSIIKTNKPFLVFLDMWMPVKDGIETLRDILAFDSNIQVVMISGHATITNALEAMKNGAFDFLEKPFTIKSVQAAVEKALIRFDSDVETQNPYSVTYSTSRQINENPHLTSPHPAALSKACSGKNLGQRTLKSSIVLYGQCLHTGMKSGLVLEPLSINSGIHFSHLGSTYTVPAYVENVQSTALATTLMSERVSASTIEHLMAALYAYGISNLLVKCNGEVPIFDGSSIKFCEVIESIGIEEQGGEWYEFAPQETFRFSPQKSNGNEEIVIEPSDETIFTYNLDYPEPVGKQSYTFHFTGSNSFKEQIASARTFGFMKDIEHMQRMGLAAGGRLDNFILIGNEGVVNTDLRFPDELVRHKILDSMGDLFLIGRPLRAKVTASMTGHADNISILNNLSTLIKDITKN